MSDDKSAKLIAGFWIRVLADIIDLVILKLLAVALTLVLEDWFVKLGENGIWFGLVVSLAYFVPPQTGWGNGQTPGKRLLRIQVLGMDGRPLSFGRSLLRYLVIAFVMYVGVFTGIATSLVGPAGKFYVDSLLGTFSIVAAIGSYLLIPLHPLKRGLHDLVAGSLVVYRDQYNASAVAKLDNPEKVKRAYVILGGVMAVVVALGGWALINLGKVPEVANMRALKARLENTGRFHNVTVAVSSSSSGAGGTRYLTVIARVVGSANRSAEDLKTDFDFVFQTVRDQTPDLASYGNVRVGLYRGYNLGIHKKILTTIQDESPSKPGERRDGGSKLEY